MSRGANVLGRANVLRRANVLGGSNVPGGANILGELIMFFWRIMSQWTNDPLLPNNRTHRKPLQNIFSLQCLHIGSNPIRLPKIVGIKNPVYLYIS